MRQRSNKVGWRLFWQRLLAHVLVFGFAVPLICVFGLSLADKGVAQTAHNAGLMFLALPWLSMFFVPVALLSLLLCYLAVRSRPAAYKRTCVLHGALWGAVIYSFFGAIQTLETAAILALTNVLVGALAGLFVSRFWKPRVELGSSDS